MRAFVSQLVGDTLSTCRCFLTRSYVAVPLEEPTNSLSIRAQAWRNLSRAVDVRLHRSPVDAYASLTIVIDRPGKAVYPGHGNRGWENGPGVTKRRENLIDRRLS